MKAMIYHHYGPPEVLELQEIEKPTIEDDEVLVRVHAASVNRHDWHFLTGTPFLARLMAGLLKPNNKVLGIDLAGKVESVGANVTQFQPGDEVFGSTSGGCFAEYVQVKQNELQPKPKNISFEEASAAGAAAFTALQGLRDTGRIETGQKILINGASGDVGTFAVQIAKSIGTEVTGVCSTRNVDLVRSLGADHVIDYTQEYFTQKEQRYDLIFDVAAKLSFSACERVLTPSGIYVTSEFSPLLTLKGQWISMTRSKKMAPLLAKPPNPKDMAFIKQLLENGQVTVVIDRCYDLSEVPEALRYLRNRRARGKIIITMQKEISNPESTSQDKRV